MADSPEAEKRDKVPNAAWLGAYLAAILEDALKDMPSTLVIRAPGDVQTVYVLQPDAEHFIVQVNRADLVIA